MWRKLSFVLLIVPVAVVLIALAVANRTPVDLILDPVGGRYRLETPLFVLIFGALIAGLLLGGFATWVSQGKWRRLARERRRETYDLRRQTDRLESELKTLQGEHQSLRLPAESGV